MSSLHRHVQSDSETNPACFCMHTTSFQRVKITGMSNCPTVSVLYFQLPHGSLDNVELWHSDSLTFLSVNCCTQFHYYIYSVSEGCQKQVLSRSNAKCRHLDQNSNSQNCVSIYDLSSRSISHASCNVPSAGRFLHRSQLGPINWWWVLLRSAAQKDHFPV
jgi:hypothetical protein